MVSRNAGNLIHFARFACKDANFSIFWTKNRGKENRFPPVKKLFSVLPLKRRGGGGDPTLIQPPPPPLFVFLFTYTVHTPRFPPFSTTHDKRNHFNLIISFSTAWFSWKFANTCLVSLHIMRVCVSHFYFSYSFPAKWSINAFALALITPEGWKRGGGRSL